MWVQWTDSSWQDGMYVYQTGMMADLPREKAIGYINAKRAIPCKPPEWAPKTKEQTGEVIPSARRKIPKVSLPLSQEMSSIINQLEASA